MQKQISSGEIMMVLYGKATIRWENGFCICDDGLLTVTVMCKMCAVIGGLRAVIV